MRVGYVVNTYPRPSQTFIRREILALEAQGIPVARFAMRRDADPVTSAEDRAEQDKTRYVLDSGALRLALALAGAVLRHPSALRAALRAGARGGPGRGRLRQLIYLAEAAILARHCRDEKLTHLHAHFGTNSTDVVRYVRLLEGPGYSFTTHGPEEFDAPHALSLGDKLREARFAVAVSAFGRSQLSRWAPFDRWDRLKVVHCGIDPAAFPDPLPLPPGPSADHPLRLVCVGRFAEQKGQMLLIEAMARTTAPVHLTLVGDGPLAPALRAAIAQAGLTDRVALPGWADEAGVRAALAQAHAMVLPSFAEGLPVALMEAMAAARPAIATIIAGIPELMVDGRTGWLVPAGDAEALARALDRAATTDPDQLRQMGLAARARALSRHDIHAEAAKLAALFRAHQQD
ncbi:glycosyltransferase family 4 protein (plasmid) [Paracoccus liaowanqingii]|uniref:Glycosyltransferase family 4 protein n=1 Tax=Paracoccus liaowanqingii TaxID=2560053 RepID=A0A4Y5STR9_9RHOB|nr:glycosyltransferase [Paracoccus liaowanqingii]QDA36759.1 glycosyltransferase family 4 protein [Paracoccus liaowanqingii]